MVDYDAIQQAALALSLDERAELGAYLMRSLRGLSEEGIERGDDLPPARLEQERKKAVNETEQIDSALIEAALSLPVKERSKLDVQLLHSLDEGIPGEVVTEEEHLASWIPELERRVRESDEGKTKSIPWEEVKRKGRELLGEL